MFHSIGLGIMPERLISPIFNNSLIKTAVKISYFSVEKQAEREFI